ncbi:MAG: phosphoglycerate mutase (2,3-diphosphoglycerate-independent) [Bacteroidetes bacterium CG2_30_32_10]|nr:MAG: phosphoglycerate mutase (2,3-diphosphoglycerate-independent) [Bacteroidetes bacterium CG2_30_32_10]
MANKKVILIILDGWGEGDKSKSDAIANANVPFINSLYLNGVHSHLKTSGEDVGLPEGQMGNSEVGHLNIGAGRVVYQDYVRINKAIQDKSIESNPALIDAYNYAKKNNCNVHFLGLVSDGGVHSSTKHLMKLCDMAKDAGLQKVFIHAFTDGRDTDSKSGINYIEELEEYLKTSTGEIASVCGRYYAMDRDKRWERIKLAYNMLVEGKAKYVKTAHQAIEESYKENITDEFIKPTIVVDNNNQPIATIKENDVVICFNFRTDRLRELTTVLSQKDMPKQGMYSRQLYYVTMARYDESFKNIHIIYDKDDLSDTLGELLAKAGKKQIRIAETEKYPHVTFFFSGGRENVFEGEKRILIQSPKVATYDLKPSMSAVEVKDAIVVELKKEETDFVCLNFANADMVGHTGIYSAILEALATVDKCVKEVVETAVAHNYSVIIIADHGNADFVINADGTPNTAHSLNPVPCFLIDKNYKKINNGKLCDIAPTILKIMEMPITSIMTGTPLV